MIIDCTEQIMNESFKNKITTEIKSIFPLVEVLLVLFVVYFWGGKYILRLLYKNFPTSPLVFLQLFSFSAVPIFVTFIFALIRYHQKPKLFLNKKMFKAVFLGIIGGYFVVVLSKVFSFEDKSAIKMIFEMDTFYFYISLFIICLWGPLFEEMLFRGYFLEQLLKKYSQTISIILSALIFVFFHNILYFFSGNIQLLFILYYCAKLFIIAVILAIVYIKAGILATTIIHVFINSYTMFIYM